MAAEKEQAEYGAEEQEKEGDEGSSDDVPPGATVFGVPLKRVQSCVTILLIAGLGIAAFFYFQPKQVRPIEAMRRKECDTEGCRQLRLFLESTVNRSADPCRDFFSFTCAAPLKKERMSKMNDDVRAKVMAMVSAADVPDRGQSAFEKAVAMYRACVSLYSQNRSEAADLRGFLFGLGLNIAEASRSRDPLDAMVQLSLAWNLPAIVSINEAGGSRLDYPHEIIFSTDESEWYQERQERVTNKTYERFIEEHLRFLLPNEDLSSIEEIKENITSTETKVVNYLLGEFKAANDQQVSQYLIRVIDVPKYLNNVVTTVVTPDVLREVMYMGFRVRQTIQKTLSSSSWFPPDAKDAARRKVEAMRLIIAYPLNLTHLSALERLYADLPDVTLTDTSGGEQDAHGTGSSFVLSWLNVSRFQRRVLVRNPTEIFFTLSSVNAQHTYSTNTVNLAGAVLQPVVYYHGAPAGYNYGGLGQLMGHEMMHGFDVTGRGIDQKGMPSNWWPEEATKKYTEQTLCLRSIHKQALRKRALALDPKLDSEDLADVMGSRVAFDALRKLPTAFDFSSRAAQEKGTSGMVAGFTELQLFFLGHCAKMCDPKVPPRERDKTETYAPNWARCVVPLMNMPEFAEAFQCESGTFMNPENRCRFW
ncbi:hypothetical protein HPB49_017806 [Dermacentor silvarum]|uniref:Uncharacterized protein n=1 Tax=Dermacentor silvarum TaxID=543639 RepID=A0ACB8CM89_DERSI|nr:hypothetical protein HPB49_017806 [Dermacentor silvarum]